MNQYLQFTSSSYSEKDEMFNISDLIEKIINKYDSQNIFHDLVPRIYVNGKKNLINRCLNNLIDNSLKYANKMKISLTKKNTNLFITIDDDGPGIPKSEYENVFKPFYKIDKSRADAVEIFRVFIPSPPVPQVSTQSLTFTLFDFSRST